MKYNTIEEIIQVAQSAEGKTFKEYDVNNRLTKKRNKGGLGHIIEEGLFKYEINSDSAPDFGKLGIELKVTPIRINKNKTLSAKERLVLNIINYMEEYSQTFETSSFWKNNEKILMIFYLWEKDLPRKDYKILKSILYEFPEEDLIIIQQDWEVIVNKIRLGKAEDLSEGDTMYLGACTKGTNKKSLREQPFSDIPAMQRAYSLKNSYMTVLVRQLLNKDKVISFSKASELKGKSIEQILEDRFSPFFGLDLLEISERIDYNINPSNKSTIANMISTILGIKGTSLKDVGEFAKANIQFKTIRLEPNDVPQEHMSFEQIDFNRWISEPFEKSQFYERFAETKFLFIVFQYKETKRKKPDRIPVFKSIKLWNMPEKTIQNELRIMWSEGRNSLEKGVELIEKGRGISNNLPKAKDNLVTHVRPKARNAADKVKLPDGQYITKQAYWLNREYVSKIIRD